MSSRTERRWRNTVSLGWRGESCVASGLQPWVLRDENGVISFSVTSFTAPQMVSVVIMRMTKLHDCQANQKVGTHSLAFNKSRHILCNGRQWQVLNLISSAGQHGLHIDLLADWVAKPPKPSPFLQLATYIRSSP